MAEKEIFIRKRMSKKVEQSLVVVTIKGAAKFTPERRHEIYKWLRRVGLQTDKNGKTFPKVYTARYTGK